MQLNDGLKAPVSLTAYPRVASFFGEVITLQINKSGIIDDKQIDKLSRNEVSSNEFQFS